MANGRNATKAQALATLKDTPERTLEELLVLAYPPKDFPFEPNEDKVIQRGKTNDCTYWGLLGYRYPMHMRYMWFMKESKNNRKSPYETEYGHDVDSLARFINDVGLPPKTYEDPVIQMKDKKKGFLADNFMWVDKVVQEAERLKKKAEKASRNVYITFEGERYRKTTINGNEEYLFWPNAKADRRHSSKKTLRRTVWEHYRGSLGGSLHLLEYIDPEGDLTDPYNMRIRPETPAQATKQRLDDFRQASADIMAGYLKLCCGCGATWRIIGRYVLDVRLPLPEEKRFGNCEKHHDSNLKRRKRWESPGAVLKAGLTIPHALLYVEEDHGFQGRGERD